MQRKYLAFSQRYGFLQGVLLTLSLLSFCLMCRFFIGCAVEKGTIYEKDGKVYGETEGLFKANWDDYYQRGLSYGEGGYWKDAAGDFVIALQKRDKDQRRARTYGMHFIDYFPNRELGIAYFKLGRYKEAIDALEISLASVESARAKFYLNKARKAWLQKTTLDKLAPSIAVQFPPPQFRTNGFAIAIKGTAQDDFFVSNLVFNGKSSHLELSRKEVSFREEFLLRHGKNVITLQSEDILGKTSAPVSLHVKVDREGPLVFLKSRLLQDGSIMVTGAVYDRSEVTKIILNNRELAFEGTQLVAVEELCDARGGSAGARIRFYAQDVLGNKTAGYIEVPSPKEGSTLSRYPILASAQPSDTFPLLPAMNLPRTPPFTQLAAGEDTNGSSQMSAIDLKGLRDGQQLFLTTLSVEGVVWAKEGIDDLSVDRDSLLAGGDATPSVSSFLVLLREKKGRPLAFSKVIKLEEGENTIASAVIDTTGRVTQKVVTVTQKIPKVRQLDSRLSLAVFPFQETKRAGESVKSYIQTFLARSFADQKRFKVLGRDKLKRACEEQHMGQAALFDQKTSVELGRLMGAETVLIGDITASLESIEIVARLIDTETSTILTEEDVYWEGQLTAGFRGILDELALKFKKAMPLCEGTVVKEEKEGLVVDLDGDQPVSEGMRFFAFCESNPLIDPVTGMDLGRDTEVISLLSVREIGQGRFTGEVVKKFSKRGVKVGDRVIAK